MKRLIALSISLLAPVALAAEKSTDKVTGLASPGALAGQVLLALILVTGLILGLAWVVKRLGLGGGFGSQKNMKILGSLAVGGRERVVVVDIAGEKLVLGVAPGRVNCLHRLDDSSFPAVEAEPAGAGAEYDFARTLKKILAPGEK